MKNIAIYLFILLLCSIEMEAQILFARHYGEFSGQATGIITDAQGNFLLAGHKHSPTSMQICLYKIKPDGDLLSSTEYGGPAEDYANGIIRTSDGGYAIIGSSKTYTTTSCITFMKFQSSGNLSWTKSIGGPGLEEGFSVVQAPSGEYFIGGKKKIANHMNDFYLVKTDINGDTLWTKSYGGMANDVVNSIVLCADGGIVMVGSTESFGAGGKDFYVIKADHNGNVQWSETFGGPFMDVGTSVKQTPDGDYIIAGHKNRSGTAGDMYVIKLTAGGTLLWERTHTEYAKGMEAHDVIVTQDGGYLVAGYADLLTIAPTSTGTVRSDLFLLRYGNNGQLQGVGHYPIDPLNGCVNASMGKSIIQLPDGNFAIGGYYFDCSTIQILLVKIKGPALAAGMSELEKPGIKIFPNPSRDKITLQLDNRYNAYAFTLFDINGIAARPAEQLSGSQVIIEKGALNSGIYFFQLKDDAGQTFSGKIIFE